MRAAETSDGTATAAGQPGPVPPDDAAAVIAEAAAPPTPEQRLERAWAVAWRALGKRDRTVAELRAMLAARAVAPEDADPVVAELIAGGYLDDAAYASRFAEDRRRLHDWGVRRIARRLTELGVAHDLVEAAVEQRPAEAEAAAAAELVARRFPTPPATRRDRDRALGVLLRKGYDADVALEALRRAGAEPPEAA